MAQKYTLTEMKKANKAAGHYFFFRGDKANFGRHKAVYDSVSGTNYVVVKQMTEMGYPRFVWYKFNATTGHIAPISPLVYSSQKFRARTEKGVFR